MVQAEAIHLLFEELGPAADDVLAVARTGERSWAVAYDEDAVVAAEFLPEQDKLVLAIELGPVEESRRLAAYTALLGYNLLWRETGGVKMALGGEVVAQLFELNAVELSLADLHDVLGNFVEKARVFRRFVAGDHAAAEPAFPAFGFAEGIRI